MSSHCVWCGKEIEDIKGQATMDTCEECEDFFEDHIEDISNTLNSLLDQNESYNANNKEEGKSKAWISYSLITAIHMLSSRPNIEFKNSKFKDSIN